MSAAPPATGYAPARRAVFHTLTLAAVAPLTADAVALTFAVPDALAADYTFRAGQHVTIATDADDVRRNYSLCSAAPAPGEAPVLRIGVKAIPGGVFSRYALQAARPGDTLRVMTPHGGFTPPPRAGTAARHHVAIAAGSGITPVLSIAATVLRDEADATFTLVYGSRGVADAMFLDELAGLKDTYPARFELIHTFSREDHDVPLRTGRLDAAKLAALTATVIPPGRADQWYLCGPHGMVTAARGTLAGHGVPARRVHFELFHATGAPPAPRPAAAGPAVGATVRFTLDGRGGTAACAGADSVLAAVLRVRPDAPFACRGGVCGTCRARLTGGEVAMDHNYALEPAELAAGYRLTCQSHPLTGTVTVDYDA